MFVDFHHFQGCLRESLQNRCKNYMSNDWLPEDSAKSIPIRGYYEEQRWTKTVKEGLEDKRISLGGVYDIFSTDTNDKKQLKILIEGEKCKTSIDLLTG